MSPDVEIILRQKYRNVREKQPGSKRGIHRPSRAGAYDRMTGIEDGMSISRKLRGFDTHTPILFYNGFNSPSIVGINSDTVG